MTENLGVEDELRTAPQIDAMLKWLWAYVPTALSIESSELDVAQIVADVAYALGDCPDWRRRAPQAVRWEILRARRALQSRHRAESASARPEKVDERELCTIESEESAIAIARELRHVATSGAESALIDEFLRCVKADQPPSLARISAKLRRSSHWGYTSWSAIRERLRVRLNERGLDVD